MPVKILIDTGSDIGCAQKRLVEKLQEHGLYPKAIKPIDLMGATGEEELNKKIKLPIRITNGKDTINITETFLVFNCPTTCFDIILGNNLMNKIIDNISYRSKTVSFVTTREATPFNKLVKIPLIKDNKENHKEDSNNNDVNISLLVRGLKTTPSISTKVEEVFTKGYINLAI